MRTPTKTLLCCSGCKDAEEAELTAPFLKLQQQTLAKLKEKKTNKKSLLKKGMMVKYIGGYGN